MRTRVNEISIMGRNTQGVRLISLTDGESLVGIERVIEDRDDNEDTGAADDAAGDATGE